MFKKISEYLNKNYIIFLYILKKKSIVVKFKHQHLRPGFVSHRGYVEENT